MYPKYWILLIVYSDRVIAAMVYVLGTAVRDLADAGFFFFARPFAAVIIFLLRRGTW